MSRQGCFKYTKSIHPVIAQARRDKQLLTDRLATVDEAVHVAPSSISLHFPSLPSVAPLPSRHPAILPAQATHRRQGPCEQDT
jgi:hypothetical protein